MALKFIFLWNTFQVLFAQRNIHNFEIYKKLRIIIKRLFDFVKPKNASALVISQNIKNRLLLLYR